MSLARRKFIRSAGTMVAGRMAGLSADEPGAEAGEYLGIGMHKRRIRIAVFVDPSFPSRESRPVTEQYLDDVLAPFERIDFTLADAATQLVPTNADLYFHPYGSAVPLDLIPVLVRFLEGGGNWLNLGGVPFSYPGSLVEGRWQLPDTRSEGYHQLGIEKFVEFPGKSVRRWKIASSLEKLITPPVLRKGSVFELSFADEPESHTRIKQLLAGMDRDGNFRVAPLQQLDWLEGRFRGARWILASFSSHLLPEEVQPLLKLTAFGPTRLVARFITEKGSPSIEVELQKAGGSVAHFLPGKASIRIIDGTSGETIHLAEAFMAFRGDIARTVFPIPPGMDISSGPTVQATFNLDRTPLGRLTSNLRLGGNSVESPR